MGWIDAAADAAITISSTVRLFDPLVRWKGKVRVGRDGTSYRIVIREHENVGNEARGRLVFAETIEV